MSDEIINADLLHHDQTNSDSQPAWGSFCTPIPNSHFWQNIDMLLEWATEQPKSKSMRYLITGITNTIANGYGLKEVRPVATIKELVREIFGDDAANDKDIVSFYEEVNRTAMQDYVAQKEGANCFSLKEVTTMLADFAVLYYESKNKDIANDAAEYSWDEYKKKFGEEPVFEEEPIGMPLFEEKYKQLYPYCQICSRIAEEESPHCEITDCPHK